VSAVATTSSSTTSRVGKTRSLLSFEKPLSTLRSEYWDTNWPTSSTTGQKVFSKSSGPA